MAKPSDKKGEVEVSPPMGERDLEVTTPIDIRKLNELLDEAQEQQGEPEGAESEPREGIQATDEARRRDTDEAEAEFASDGGSIAEALMRATDNFPSVGPLIDEAAAAKAPPATGRRPGSGGFDVAALRGRPGSGRFEVPPPAAVGRPEVAGAGSGRHEMPSGASAVRARPASVRSRSEASDEFDLASDTNPQGALRRARALEAAGAYQTALDACERMLASGGGDEVEVRALAQKLRNTLADQAEAKLGSLERRPRARLGVGELRERKIDPKAAFLLSLIDGRMTYQELLSVSGMSRFETLLVLAKLRDAGLVTAD